MTTLFAQPYDISATGFYFDCAEDYLTKAKALRNAFGQPVEEFEIQFIDGDEIDAELADTWGLSQCSLESFFKATDDWSDYQKQCFIIAVGECGYDFDPETVNPDDFDVIIYHCDTMKELAEQFVDEGYYGDIPASLAAYIDFDAIAYDLNMDYSEITIAGTNLIYACP